MVNRIIATTQQEFDNAVAKQQQIFKTRVIKTKINYPIITINGGTKNNPIDVGEYNHFLIIKGSSVVKAIKTNGMLLYDNATVTVEKDTFVDARDDAVVYAKNNCKVSAHNNAKAYVEGKCVVYAHGESTINTKGHCTVYSYDDSVIYAHDNTYIEANYSSTVSAHQECVVDAYDNSRVYAYNSTHINFYSFLPLLCLHDYATKENKTTPVTKNKKSKQNACN